MTNVIHAEFQFEDDDEGEGRRKRGRPRQRKSYAQTMDEVTHHFCFAASHPNEPPGSKTIKYPESMGTRITVLTESSRTPFTTHADVWREAMYHYLIFMEQWLQDDEFSELVEITRRQVETDYHLKENRLARTLVEDTARALEEAIADENWMRVEKLISHGQNVVNTSTVSTSKLDQALQRARHEMEMK